MASGKHHKKVDYKRRAAVALVVCSLSFTSWGAVRVSSLHLDLTLRPDVVSASVSGVDPPDPTGTPNGSSDRPFYGPPQPTLTTSTVPPSTTAPPTTTSRPRAAQDQRSTVPTTTPPPTTTTTTPRNVPRSSPNPEPAPRTQPDRPIASGSCSDSTDSRLGTQSHVTLAAADIAQRVSFAGAMGGRAGRPDNPTSDHPKGLAVDFMTRDLGLGNAIRDYALGNKERLAVEYVIWRQRYYGPGSPGGRLMEDRGGDTDNHYDHVHISFTSDPGSGFDPRCR